MILPRKATFHEDITRRVLSAEKMVLCYGRWTLNVLSNLQEETQTSGQLAFSLKNSSPEDFQQEMATRMDMSDVSGVFSLMGPRFKFLFPDLELSIENPLLFWHHLFYLMVGRGKWLRNKLLWSSLMSISIGRKENIKWRSCRLWEQRCYLSWKTVLCRGFSKNI